MMDNEDNSHEVKVEVEELPKFSLWAMRQHGVLDVMKATSLEEKLNCVSIFSSSVDLTSAGCIRIGSAKIAEISLVKDEVLCQRLAARIDESIEGLKKDFADKLNELECQRKSLQLLPFKD